MIVVIPLLFFPETILNLLNLTGVEMARIVGAAFLGIGLASFFTKKKDYDIMLTLKILWSITAMIGLIISIFAGAYKLWPVLVIFVIFNLVWVYYKVEK